MKTLAYTTSIMSWRLLLSAIKRTQQEGTQQNENLTIRELDINQETPTCIILCCTAIEAFVNEISCLASAFLFSEEQNNHADFVTLEERENDIGLSFADCEEIKKIKDDKKGSFYSRYKLLIKTPKLSKSKFDLFNLHLLHKLRNALVHFRECEIPIIENLQGIIQSDQPEPPTFKDLKKIKFNNQPIIARDAVGEDWTLRVSTNAMAIWSLDVTLKAILHIINSLPEGEYKRLVLSRYQPSDEYKDSVLKQCKSSEVEIEITNIFQLAEKELEVWANELLVTKKW